jgi:hypothetical protein
MMPMFLMVDNLAFDAIASWQAVEKRPSPALHAHPSSLQRTRMYASFLRMSRALHLDVFEQPAENIFQQPSTV